MDVESLIIEIIKSTGLSRKEISELIILKRIEENESYTKKRALIKVCNDLAIF
jgi:hypothetical protein